MEIISVNSSLEMNLRSCEKKKMRSKRKRRANFSPLHMMAFLEEEDDDIIIEILFRLPVKSLFAFKCVSKKWNNFISHDPYFRNHYHDAASSFPLPGSLVLGFFYQNRCNFNFCYQYEFEEIKFKSTSQQGNILPVVFDNILKSLYLVDSSNGFLLLCTTTHTHPCEYYIFNPITKQSFSLPKPNMIDNSRLIHGLLTAFICQENFSHSLAYKVVRITVQAGGFLKIEMLSSEDKIHEWREFHLTSPCDFRFEVGSYGPPFPRTIISETTGIVYWSGYTRIVHPIAYGISAFDPSQYEEDPLQLETIAYPKEKLNTSSGDHYCCLGQTNGLLVYVSYNEDDLNLWVMNDEHKKEWTLNYEVNHYDLLVNSFPMNELLIFHVKAFHPLHPHLLLVQLKENEIYLCRNSRTLKGRKIFWFHLENSTLELLPIGDEHMRSEQLFLPCLSSPSLSLFSRVSE